MMWRSASQLTTRIEPTESNPMLKTSVGIKLKVGSILIKKNLAAAVAATDCAAQLTKSITEPYAMLSEGIR
jgi:hypothetical protein